MIAATIGRKFLLAYNRKFGTHYDAKTFFTEQYFPLFFDHEKYMQWVTNSPFVQGIKKGKCLTAVERRPDFVNVSPKNHLQIMGRYVDVVS